MLEKMSDFCGTCCVYENHKKENTTLIVVEGTMNKVG